MNETDGQQVTSEQICHLLSCELMGGERREEEDSAAAQQEKIADLDRKA